MPYGDFASREDVYGIISKTLTRHYGTNVKVAGKREKTDPLSTMYCFPRLGIVIPANPCQSIIEQVKREYRITYSFSRKALMDTYIAGVFAAPKQFCEKKLVFPSGVVNRELFIEPGNKKIKIIDHKTRIINNIVKEGFRRDWIEKEIEFRSGNKKEYIIPLKRTSEGYSEELHIGYSFPRLEESRKKAIQGFVNDILIDYASISDNTKGKDYIEPLINEIGVHICTIKKERTSQLFNLLKSINLCCDSMIIPLCMSHGDLQQGNFFYDTDQKKVYLIDWETWSKRSCWYDKFLYYYGFRNSTKFAQNISNYLNDLRDKVLGENTERKKQIKALLVFIVEDIKWQLDELKVLPEGCLPNGLNEYLKVDSLKRIDSLLSEVR